MIKSLFVILCLASGFAGALIIANHDDGGISGCNVHMDSIGCLIERLK